MKRSHRSARKEEKTREPSLVGTAAVYKRREDLVVELSLWQGNQPIVGSIFSDERTIMPLTRLQQEEVVVSPRCQSSEFVGNLIFKFFRDRLGLSNPDGDDDGQSKAVVIRTNLATWVPKIEKILQRPEAKAIGNRPWKLEKLNRQWRHRGEMCQRCVPVEEVRPFESKITGKAKRGRSELESKPTTSKGLA